MNMGYETRYKDCDPLKTITTIRGILSGLGILAKETWMHDVDGYYSLLLQADDVGLYSNGKGTTQAYALASAYAEMIERIQNLVFVTFNKNNGSKRFEALKYKGFAIAPDEKILSARELADRNERWLAKFTGDASTLEEKIQILEKWQSTGDYSDENGFLSVPYTSLLYGSICHIPLAMLISMYWSNGMCAGNTSKEALVQGLSEVIERYVQKRIVYDRITPPTVPVSYIDANYPYLHAMIERLEAKGDFKVIVKDCSLGRGFPVVAVILANRKEQTYYVKFGSHPAFEIALERSLTELLQGKPPNDPYWMVRFTFSESDIFSSRNLENIFTNGIAYYPIEVFGSHDNYEFTGWSGMSGNDNETMLSYLTGLLHAEGYEILIRDVSFLGFPSYHIVVPLLSEIYDSAMWLNQNYLPLRTQLNNSICGILRRLGDANPEEINEVIKYVNEMEPDSSIAQWINKWFGTGFPWERIKRDLFLSSAYYRIGDYKKAAEAMENYIKDAKPNLNNISLLYYNCIKDFFNALQFGLKGEAEISALLNNIYPDKVVIKVASDLKNPTDVFKNCSGLDCYNCGLCLYANKCEYSRKESLYIKLKEAYAQNTIDQSKVNSCFVYGDNNGKSA